MLQTFDPSLCVYYLPLLPPMKYVCMGGQGQGWVWGLSACGQIGASQIQQGMPENTWPPQALEVLWEPV